MPKAGAKKTGEVKAKPKAFRVQVHIIEAKDVKPMAGGMPDLVCTASVGNYGTKYTQVVRQSTSATFDTFMEWKFMATFEEMNNSSLSLRVLNANTDAKSEMLGMYDLPLSQIRKQPLGEYFMTWLALYSDPSEYVTELSGGLRATITCLGGNQQVPTHSEEEVGRWCRSVGGPRDAGTAASQRTSCFDTAAVAATAAARGGRSVLDRARRGL